MSAFLGLNLRNKNHNTCFMQDWKVSLKKCKWIAQGKDTGNSLGFFYFKVIIKSHSKEILNESLITLHNLPKLLSPACSCIKSEQLEKKKPGFCWSRMARKRLSSEDICHRDETQWIEVQYTWLHLCLKKVYSTQAEQTYWAYQTHPESSYSNAPNKNPALSIFAWITPSYNSRTSATIK